MKYFAFLRKLRPRHLIPRHTGIMLSAGALSALALPPVHCLFVLLLTFPLLARTIDKSSDWKRAAWAGAMFGFGFYATSLYWLVNAVMIRAADFWWFVPFPSLGCALILAPVTAAPAALCRLIRPGPLRMIALAAGWTLCDMGRVFIFSGFPWNPLGSALAIPGSAGDILIQPAAWMGVDGMTFVIVLLSLFCGAALQDGWRQRHNKSVLLQQAKTRYRTLLAGSLFIITWVSAGFLRLHTVHPQGVNGPIAVIVQGNIPESEKVENLSPQSIFERYLTLTRQGVQQALTQQKSNPGATKDPVVFLWPETSFPGYTLLQDSPRARQIIMAWAEGAQAGLIGALREDQNGQYRNSVMALSPDGAIEATYDKAKLVPFGEYQPAFIPLQIVPGGGIAPGPGPQTWHLDNVPATGPLICYEVIFSGDVVNQHDRPRWLANVTNDAWFGNSAGPRQHLSSVRLRATEEGLPVARAANTGISIAYDGYGREIKHLGWDKTGFLVVNIPPALPSTLFSKAGRISYFSLILLIFISCLIISKIDNKNKHLN